jgi:hypothetical protein
MHHFNINEKLFKYKLSKEEVQQVRINGFNTQSINQRIPIESSLPRAGKHKGNKCDLCGKFMRADAIARHRGKRECIKFQQK